MNAKEPLLTRPTIVGDLMALEPIVVPGWASLTDAARIMDEYDISGLPVVGEAGDVVGVISQTDLVRARATEWLWSNWTGLQVRHLMTSPPLTIHRSASLESAAVRMEHDHVHRLVVVADDDPSIPIGVISTSDVVRALARDA
ncbi:MAG TPA: CBS domain-containing protein [Candidatus Limnocylindrales bacterium]|jgi:CBS domain-containing protein